MCIRDRFSDSRPVAASIPAINPAGRWDRTMAEVTRPSREWRPGACFLTVKWKPRRCWRGQARNGPAAMNPAAVPVRGGQAAVAPISAAAPAELAWAGAAAVTEVEAEAETMAAARKAEPMKAGHKRRPSM